MKNSIGVIGIGKLGVCLALNLERAGFKVFGIEKNKRIVSSIKNNTYNNDEPKVGWLLNKSKYITVSTDISLLLREKIEIIFLTVATPSSEDKTSYDHSQIERVVNDLLKIKFKTYPVHLVIVCTTTPGYCDALSERLKPFNIIVSYNPEFIAQGSIIKDQQYPDQILIGANNKKSGDIVESINKKISKNKPIINTMSLLSAEITKLAINCYLTTKISFANSIGDLSVKNNLKSSQILNAISSDSRIGKKYLRYGDGYGGPCLPRDNRVLYAYAKQCDIKLHIGKATDLANTDHLDFQLEQLLKNNPPETIFTFENLSYKNGTSMIEESQKLLLAVKVAKNDRTVLIKDSNGIISEIKALYGDLFIYKIIKK